MTGMGLEKSGVAIPESNRPRRATVLVVDDEPEVLRSLHDLLRLDYRVITKATGKEAVAVMESDEPVDVVMSDQRMPGMSGVEVLGKASQLRPDATRLLITAYADIKAVIDAINEGSIHRYIHKPWSPEELQAVIRQAVAQHDLVAERDRLLAELTESNRRLVEADRLKSAFLEVASHELNTPVAIVLGLAQLWRLTRGEAATENERSWMDRIHRAGKRLAGTVDRMLQLARAEDFGPPLDLHPTAIEPLVRATVEGALPFIEARRQHVEVEVETDIGEAEVDPSKITDALTNLILNAVKFTPDGGSLRVSASREGPDNVRFVVADTGVGIPREVRPHVFEPFFTGFDTRHHSSGEFEFRKKGIGLGLCLVKRFVEMHGGSVGFSSSPEIGTTFSFTIPRARPGSRPSGEVGRGGVLSRPAS